MLSTPNAVAHQDNGHKAEMVTRLGKGGNEILPGIKVSKKGVESGVPIPVLPTNLFH